MESSNHTDYEQLIFKILTGEASGEEVSLVKNWVRSSPQNHNHYLRVKNLLEISGKPLKLSENEIKMGLLSVMERIESSSTKRMWQNLQKIAAVLLLPVLLATLLLTSHYVRKESKSQIAYNEFSTPLGSRSNIKLADGSVVWLNSGSTLKYPVSFGSRKRVVYLTGEALFEVKSDNSLPFIVETSKIKVRATGTLFNVKESTPDNLTEVTLAEGKVAVFKSVLGEDGQLISNMLPNQHLICNTGDDTHSLQDEDAYPFYAWKNGELIFRNEPLKNIVKELSQFFNVDIEIQGKEIQELPIRGTFENESLNEILKLLKIISPINYKEIDRIQINNDKFSKRKIIISPQIK
jgi:ferric-dicitrate binding protein FerR (iron transport regulator)